MDSVTPYSETPAWAIQRRRILNWKALENCNISIKMFVNTLHAMASVHCKYGFICILYYTHSIVHLNVCAVCIYYGKVFVANLSYSACDHSPGFRVRSLKHSSKWKNNKPYEWMKLNWTGDRESKEYGEENRNHKLFWLLVPWFVK